MEADVAIVGAGAAGSFFAAKLAKAGKRVVVLESGPAWQVGDLVSSQLWARRLKWGGPPVPSGAPPTMSHNLSFGWGLGGAALHHYATWPRFSEDAFELRSRYGSGLDWPITYANLRPHYDRIQDEMGVSGDAAQEPDRPPAAPYPMPALLTLKHGQVMRRGFDALGMPVAPLPAAINSEERNGRPACLYDGWCDAGCPIGALANPLITHIPAAKAAGATFLTDTTVVELLADAQGVRTLRAVTAMGEEVTVSCAVAILAASVVQNPRLMLASRSASHPDGLGNANGLVGAHLRIEAGASAFALFDDTTEAHQGINAGQLIYRGRHRAPGRPDGGYQWQIAPAMKPNDIFGVAFTRADLFGERLHRFLRDDARRLGSMVGFGADPSRRENRVALSQDKDTFGVPLAQIQYERASASVALWDHMNEEGGRVLRAGGAKEVWSGPLTSGHVSGGTIMGDDPGASVTDSYGRAHAVRNLLIAGAGLFPESDGASPTFTLYALASRTAEHLLANWGDYAVG